MKVLAVDDDEGILDALSLVLIESGFEVATVLKASQVYQAITKFKPDVILLDVLMSGIDGRDVCKKLKKIPGVKEIPVIILSAHPSAKKSYVICGADDFLPKPFEASELLSKIEKYRTQYHS